MDTTQRSGHDVIASLLSEMHVPRLKSHLMYDCILNSKQIGEYMALMTRAGLIRYAGTKNGRRLYVSTDKGERFLAIHKQLDAILKS